MQNTLTGLSIVYRATEALTPYSGNARTHSKRQIRQIAESIRNFGFTNPILVDAKNTIIAGHGRWEAAKLLKLETVPTICLEGLTEDEVRAYIIADNRLAELAGWDKEILAIELQHLVTADLNFDIGVIGFEVAEIDLLVGNAGAEDPDDEQELVLAGEPITRAGDLWLLGEHRILCGSALDPSSHAALMNGRQAEMVFVDPPYNVVIAGNVSGNGAIRHGNFQMASGEMSEAEFTKFLEESFRLLIQSSISGSVHFVCMDWKHLRELLAAGEVYEKLLNLCVWAKDNGGMGAFYRSQHELVFVFRNGREQHRNNIRLGKFGRYRTNLWNYPGVRSLSQHQGEEGNLLALHPTVKPVALIADAMLDCSAPNGLILDSFLGSGSTLIAAERTGRVCYGIELAPMYVDTAIRRWQRYTGGEAIHAVTGKPFHEAEEKAHG